MCVKERETERERAERARERESVCVVLPAIPSGARREVDALDVVRERPRLKSTVHEFCVAHPHTPCGRSRITWEYNPV